MSISEKPGFFGVVVNPQSYLNILYLLLAFPLGTFYFVFLVTGFSLGFGMIILIVGIPDLPPLMIPFLKSLPQLR